MTESPYVEHQKHEIAGFQVVDATSTGQRPHDDLIWIGLASGNGGQWVTPETAMALVSAIATTAHGNMERRRTAAQIADDLPLRSTPAPQQQEVLRPLEPLSFDGLPYTKITLLNPVGRFQTDPEFTMKWLQTVADVTLTPEWIQEAARMALDEAAKGEKLTLMTVVNLWRPVPELRYFAESLYMVALPGPFVPSNVPTAFLTNG